MESIRWLLAAAGIEVCVLGFHSQVQKLQMVEAEQLCTSLNTGYRGSIVGEKCIDCSQPSLLQGNMEIEPSACMFESMGTLAQVKSFM